MTQNTNEGLNATAIQETVNDVEETVNDVVETADFDWTSFDEQTNDDTIETIVSRCLADRKQFILKRNLHVKNVTATVSLSKNSNLKVTRYTFVTKEIIPGMIKSTTEFDAFGEPIFKIGPSHNVFTFAYAVGGTMKETAKGSIWAKTVSNLTAEIPIGQIQVQIDDHIANDLYAGGIIDVLCQFVPAGHPYVNPFSNNTETTIFNEDRIFHHIVSLTFGEVGNDMYLARLSR